MPIIPPVLSVEEVSFSDLVTTVLVGTSVAIVVGIAVGCIVGFGEGLRVELMVTGLEVTPLLSAVAWYKEAPVTK